ncbi:MAG: hypothetical protein PVF76_18115 [Syntrophobacterales bacterium]|jgi:hypothetical protein
MKQMNSITNVSEMTDRLMIELYKNKIQERNLDLNLLKGTWTEASDILKAHFGRISRTMEHNKGKLHALYQTAIRELNGH